ncbi:hypothetical protein [Luteococcus sp. OSA5]|uniref:hypothetical protein n=1 Tax=Luteococcus sp. OSA5 TaxID=3401630 RepID=UPI003B4344EE
MRTAGEFTGADAAWIQAMVHRLEARGVGAREVNDAYGYVQDVCRRVRTGPKAQFGDPVAFADRLEFPLDPVQTSPGHALARALGATRVHVLGILMVFLMVMSCLASFLSVAAMARGQDHITVTVGAVLGPLGMLAVVLLLTQLPPHLLYRHTLLTGLTLVLVMVALCVFAVLASAPLLLVGWQLVAGLSLVVLVLYTVVFTWSGIKEYRNDPDWATTLWSYLPVGWLLMLGPWATHFLGLW